MTFFVNKFNLIFENQYGFIEKHSTYMALLNIIDSISAEMDNKKYSIGIVLDLSKAFDIIDHNIVLKKLDMYGVRCIALCWLRDYLSFRTQCVSLGNEISASSIMKCGVPQGSILGPLLFIIYMNDIVNSSELLQFVLFADDTNLFASHVNLDALLILINTELLKVSNWLKINKLSLNVKKIHFIAFHNRQQNFSKSVKIKIENCDIAQENVTKLLDVVINKNLTWTDHINIISNNISINLGVIRKLSKSLPVDVLHILYNTLISSDLQYCNVAWATSKTTVLEKLFRIPKKNCQHHYT